VCGRRPAGLTVRTREWIKPTWLVHTREYYSAVKRKFSQGYNKDDLEDALLSEL
jgi:hypothetical protein